MRFTRGCNFFINTILTLVNYFNALTYFSFLLENMKLLSNNKTTRFMYLMFYDWDEKTAFFICSIEGLWADDDPYAEKI